MVKKQSKKDSLDNKGHGWHIYIFFLKLKQLIETQTMHIHDLSNLTY